MNEWFKPEILIQIFALAITGVATYAAIKSDIRALHEKLQATNERVTKVEGDVSNLIFSGDRRRVL